MLSGTNYASDGARIDRMLVATTRHMPDISEDLSTWAWGEEPNFGITLVFAYEEDSGIDGKTMPAWLLDLCLAARDRYNCNWVLLDPDGGEVVPGLPLYDPEPLPDEPPFQDFSASMLGL